MLVFLNLLATNILEMKRSVFRDFSVLIAVEKTTVAVEITFFKMQKDKIPKLAARDNSNIYLDKKLQGCRQSCSVGSKLLLQVLVMCM